MAITVYPLNRIDYDAHDVETYNSTRSSGIFAGEDFEISSISGNLINISAGEAWIAPQRFVGKKLTMEQSQSVDIGAGAVANDRIDAVAIAFNASQNNAEIIYKKGAEASSPVPPERVTTPSNYELHLYHIHRRAGIVGISMSDVEDVRGDSKWCGYMADAVSKVDSTLTKKGWLADAYEVGKRVKDILSKITSLTTKTKNNETAISNLATQTETAISNLAKQTDNTNKKQDSKIANLEKNVRPIATGGTGTSVAVQRWTITSSGNMDNLYTDNFYVPYIGACSLNVLGSTKVQVEEGQFLPIGRITSSTYQSGARVVPLNTNLYNAYATIEDNILKISSKAKIPKGTPIRIWGNYFTSKNY